MEEYQRRTERLLLRPLHAADRAEFERVHELSASFLAPWLPTPAPGAPPLPDFDTELERVARGLAAGTHVRLVGVMAGGRIAGFFNLSEIVRGAFHCAYASWSVSADVARRGYGSEGVRGLLAIAFTPPSAGLGLHRVQANVIPENEPSMRLAQAVGFRREGLALRYLHIGGCWRDHVMWAMTAEEWQPRASAGAPPPGA